ncbi:MAG: substrate-binding domain-containing protein [Planctomycetota bacterium]
MLRKNLVFISILVLCILSACSSKETPSGENRITIAVIPKGTTHEYWKSVHAGAAKAAKELDIDIIWKGPLKEDDREAQIAVVEDFITRGVSGIVLAPLDDMALRRPVTSAVKNNIPVVIADSGLKSEDYISFVATDNHRGGELAGERLAELLGKKGRIIMLRYQEGSASTMNREQGFLDAVSRYPEMEIVSTNQYGGATTESAHRASENLLAPLKTEDNALTVDGIFCPNESTTFGMLRALQNAGLAGKVFFIGFDCSAKLLEALQNKEIHGLVIQNPMRMGYLGVKTLVAHLNGEAVEKRIDTGVVLATPDNMNETEIKNLLQPDISRWLD